MLLFYLSVFLLISLFLLRSSFFCSCIVLSIATLRNSSWFVLMSLYDPSSFGVILSDLLNSLPRQIFRNFSSSISIYGIPFIMFFCFSFLDGPFLPLFFSIVMPRQNIPVDSNNIFLFYSLFIFFSPLMFLLILNLVS